MEKMVLGGAVVTNGNHSSCDLVIENNVPILRQKDIMNDSEADTPCSKIYYVVQLMYIDDENLSIYQKTYWQLIKDVVSAAPSSLGFIDEISELILRAQYYQALKLVRKLIDYEQEVINRVTEPVPSL